MDEVARLLGVQSGVISRRQLLQAGLSPADLKRLLRRRELTRIHNGVFVEHTGPTTWLQRAWAAVLFASPAAFCSPSAIRAASGPGLRGQDDDGPIHVAVDSDRRFVSPDGVVPHRLAEFAHKSLLNTSPPPPGSSRRWRADGASPGACSWRRTCKTFRWARVRHSNTPI